MIFASDLDRTIVYSERAIEEFGRPAGAKLIPVEQRAGNWVAYMTEDSYNLLKVLSNKCLFVPVTTRTTSQYKRFVIFKDDIKVKYAVTANGANILLQGQPMKDWSSHIHECLKKESVSQTELLSILSKEGVLLDGERKQAEEWFFYYLLNGLPSAFERRSIDLLAAKNGWRTSLQGRKLYFVPKPISKGSALDFICKLEGVKTVAGAGDSLLDWDFLINCQYRFVPNHGELARQKALISENENSMLTRSSGVKAGEEIIQQFMKLFT